MKKITAFLIVLLVLISVPSAALAHLAGQPPFFKINGVYSNLYPIPSTSLNDFPLPQDLAAENYLVGQNLSFTIDTTQLPVAPQALSQTKFLWDFGDGTKGEGLANTHVYKKMGSYILTIDAQVNAEQPQLIQSVLLNVLPDKNYQLPTAIIKVNGKGSKDPLTAIIKLKFGEDFQFDGSSSQAPSSKIVSYFWDFGDQEKSSEPNPTHAYSPQFSQIFPLLRVKDANGFIADSFVEVENDMGGTQTDTKAISSTSKKTSAQPVLLITLALLVVLAVAGGFYLYKRSKAQKTNLPRSDSDKMI